LKNYTIIRSAVPSNITRRAVAATPVLLASSRSEDLDLIPALLPREQWMLIKVASWTDVLQLLGAVILPIVLCDRELPGLDWPQDLAQLRRPFRPPALVLLSDLAAGSLWQEVIRYGGFDMLFRPLRQGRLIAALDLARTHWDMRLDSNAETEFRLTP
jgi:AmiR/NasT family two-component response regulator